MEGQVDEAPEAIGTELRAPPESMTIANRDAGRDGTYRTRTDPKIISRYLEAAPDGVAILRTADGVRERAMPLAQFGYAPDRLSGAAWSPAADAVLVWPAMNEAASRMAILPARRADPGAATFRYSRDPGRLLAGLLLIWRKAIAQSNEMILSVPSDMLNDDGGRHGCRFVEPRSN